MHHVLGYLLFRECKENVLSVNDDSSQEQNADCYM